MKTKTHAVQCGGGSGSGSASARRTQENVSVFFSNPSPLPPPFLPPAFPTVMSAEILLTPLRTAAVESLLQCITASSTTTTMLFTEAPPSSQPPLSPSVTSPSGVSLQTRRTRESRPHAYRRAGETRVQHPPTPAPKTLNAAAARFPQYRLAEVSAPNEPAVSHRAGESVQKGGGGGAVWGR